MEIDIVLRVGLDFSRVGLDFSRVESSGFTRGSDKN
jgi:hypothetical protein